MTVRLAIWMVVPALLSVCFGPILAADTAQAAKAGKSCLTKSEARGQYPRAHLYYRLQRGKKCWSNRRGDTLPRRAALASAEHTQTTPSVVPAPPPRPVTVTPRLEIVATRAAPPVPYWPMPVLPPVPLIYAAADDPAPWDIWPPLEPDATAAMAAVPLPPPGPLVALLCGFLCFAVGLAVRRRHLNRVRITPLEMFPNRKYL